MNQVIRAESLPGSIGRANQAQERSSYVGYKLVAKKLTFALSYLVSFHTRVQVKSKIGRVYECLLEVRRRLVGVGPEFTQFIDVSAALGHLELGPESIEWDAFPLLGDSRDLSRLGQLMSQFGHSKAPDALTSGLSDPLYVHYTVEQAKAIITRHEMGRVGMTEGAARIKAFLREGSSHSEPAVPVDPASAATRIASVFRMYRARKAFNAERLRELTFLGLLPPTEPPAELTRLNEILEERSAEAFRIEAEWRKSKVAATEKVRSQIESEMNRGFLQATRAEVWKFRALNGTFPTTIEEMLGKTTGSAVPPVGAVPALSALEELQSVASKFDLDWKQDLVSVDERTAIQLSIKTELLRKLNAELHGMKLVSGLVSDRSEPAGPPTGESPDEQDTIDLIKEGVINSVVPAVLKEWVGDIFSAHRENPSVSQLKTVVCEACILPLLSASLIKAKGNSLLLYGPRACGKSLIARIITTESRAVFFDLSGKTLSQDSLDKVARVAVELQPCVVYLDAIDTLFAAPPKKGGKPSKELSPIEKLTVLMDKLKPHRIVFIATTASPVDPLVEHRNLFATKLYVPTLNVADRRAFLKSELVKRQVPTAVLDRSVVFLDTLTAVTENIATLNLARMIDFVVTPRRVELLGKRPFDAREFVDALSRLKCVTPEESQQWCKFDREMHGIVAVDAKSPPKAEKPGLKPSKTK